MVEAIRQGKPLEDRTLSELQKFSQVIDEDVYPILSLQRASTSRAAKGGVSPQQVAQAIAFAQARLGKNIYMYKFEPAYRRAFYGKKADPRRSAKVHVGFSYSS